MLGKRASWSLEDAAQCVGNVRHLEPTPVDIADREDAEHHLVLLEGYAGMEHDAGAHGGRSGGLPGIPAGAKRRLEWLTA